MQVKLGELEFTESKAKATAESAEATAQAAKQRLARDSRAMHSLEGRLASAERLLKEASADRDRARGEAEAQRARADDLALQAAALRGRVTELSRRVTSIRADSAPASPQGEGPQLAGQLAAARDEARRKGAEVSSLRSQLQAALGRGPHVGPGGGGAEVAAMQALLAQELAQCDLDLTHLAAGVGGAAAHPSGATLSAAPLPDWQERGPVADQSRGRGRLVHGRADRVVANPALSPRVRHPRRRTNASGTTEEALPRPAQREADAPAVGPAFDAPLAPGSDRWGGIVPGLGPVGPTTAGSSPETMVPFGRAVPFSGDLDLMPPPPPSGLGFAAPGQRLRRPSATSLRSAATTGSAQNSALDTPRSTWSQGSEPVGVGRPASRATATSRLDRLATPRRPRARRGSAL